MPSRQDLYYIVVTVDGENIGVFDAWTGGDGDSEESTYDDGNGVRQALGGKQTRENVVVSRLVSPERDLDLYRRLDAKRGKVDMTATKYLCDDDRNPISPPIAARHGRFKRICDPQANSNESSESLFELEMIRPAMSEMVTVTSASRSRE